MKLSDPALKAALTLAVFVVHVAFTGSASAACNADAPETTPTGDFTVNNDGTVTHDATGLMWKVCSEGQTWNAGNCDNAGTTHNWQQALQIPQTLNTGGGFAGHSDWRLPNLKELISIMELKCSNPVINEVIFNNVPLIWYWSSSPSASGSDSSWGANFSSGSTRDGLRDDSIYVRLVRSVE